MKKLISLVVVSFTLASASAFAETVKYVYQCHSTESDVDTQVSIYENQDLISVGGDLADFDSSYTPRLNLGLERFAYKHIDGGEVLIKSAMFHGSETGIIKIQERDETFGTETYTCRLD